MSIFSSPEEHAANPPETWEVVKAAYGTNPWRLMVCGHTLESFKTKKEALAARATGFYARLYEKELHWYAGGSVPGWRAYAEVSASRTQLGSDR